MASCEQSQWRVGVVYWRDGVAGALAVAYIGFDLAAGTAIDCLTCSLPRLHRIADYAGLERDAFVNDVVDEMTSLAEETAADWEQRAQRSGNSAWRFFRGELVRIEPASDDTMRDHLTSFVREADRTWNRISEHCR